MCVLFWICVARAVISLWGRILISPRVQQNTAEFRLWHCLTHAPQPHRTKDWVFASLNKSYFIFECLIRLLYHINQLNVPNVFILLLFCCWSSPCCQLTMCKILPSGSSGHRRTPRFFRNGTGISWAQHGLDVCNNWLPTGYDLMALQVSFTSNSEPLC